MAIWMASSSYRMDITTSTGRFSKRQVMVTLQVIRARATYICFVTVTQ